VVNSAEKPAYSIQRASSNPDKIAMSKTSEILRLAREIAQTHRDIFNLNRNGINRQRLTKKFMDDLNKAVRARVGPDLSDRAISGDSGFSVDFYVQEEATVIEVELFGLSKSHTNLERDIFKVLLARDKGNAVTRLILLGGPKCRQRQSEPAPKHIVNWVERHHQLKVDVVEIEPAAS